MKSRRLIFWLGYFAGAFGVSALQRAKEDLYGLEGYIAHLRATWIGGWWSWLATIWLFCLGAACLIKGVLSTNPRRY